MKAWASSRVTEVVVPNASSSVATALIVAVGSRIGNDAIGAFDRNANVVRVERRKGKTLAANDGMVSVLDSDYLLLR